MVGGCWPWGSAVLAEKDGLAAGWGWGWEGPEGQPKEEAGRAGSSWAALAPAVVAAAG
jgi:hypothetical protein